MRTVIKTIITTVSLSVLLAPFGNAEARLKYYRYNDNIPMVEMSLNMMVAMGVLEPIPGRLVHDGNPYSRYAGSRYGRYSRSPYLDRASTRYLGRSRYYDDFRDEPIRPYRRYSRSRYNYLSDPSWDYYRDDYWDSPWAGRWGDPLYSGWDSYRYSRRGSPWDSYGYSRWGSPWDSYGYSRWGNPWDSYGYSPWSNPWSYSGYTGGLNPWSTLMANPYGYLGNWPSLQGYSLPIVPDSLLGDEILNSNPYKRDEPPQQLQQRNGVKAQKTAWPVRSRADYKRITARDGKARNRTNRTYQHLNGLWIDDNGEMLGIRGDRFLWNDKNRYAKGLLIKSPTMMEARIKETRTRIRFRYKLRGDEMVITSRDGRMRTFHRMPLAESQLAAAQPQATHSNYRPNTAHLHVGYSRYRSGPEPSALDRPRAHKRPDQRSARRAPAISAVSVAYPHREPAVAVRSVPISTGIGQSDAAGGNEILHKGSLAASESANKAGKGQLSETARQEPSGSTQAETAPALPEGADANDPYNYLYSYLKDPAFTGGADVAAAEGEGPGDGNRSSNIWKPNELFPNRRRDSSAHGNAQSANTSDARSAWSKYNSWN